MIPSSGLLMSTNQKKPKLLLFTSVIEQAEGRYIFAHTDEKGKQKIITRLTIKQEKTKQIETIKEELKKLIIFEFKGIRRTNEDGMLKLECFKA